MKTWKEIETKLMADDGDAFPAGLHDRIVRAVRDDRAAASPAAPPRRLAGLWLMAGATAVALVAAAAGLLLASRSRMSPVQTPGAPGLSLERIEAIATGPMKSEYENLQADIASAARFVSASLPSAASGS